MTDLKETTLEIMKNFFAGSLSNFAIIDSFFNILWSNEDKIHGNLSESDFSFLPNRSKTLNFPTSKESYCRLKVSNDVIFIKVQPIFEDDLAFPAGYALSLAEAFDVFSKNTISQNHVASIREYVSGIIANINVLHSVLESSEMYDEMEFVKGTVSNCYQLLSAISNASEINNYFTKKIKITSQNASAFLEDVINICKSYLREDCIIYADIEPNIMMSIDFERFATAIVNLIINGVKYNISEMKEINISFQKQNNQVILKVSDNGVGIDPKIIENLFSVSTLNDMSFNGSEGLGLAVVKMFTDQFDGSIQYQTKNDFGTSFFIRLPIIEQPATHVNSRTSDYIQNKFSPIYVLLAKVTKIKYI